jgi:7-cyano-7-deazaguanine reductase
MRELMTLPNNTSGQRLFMQHAVDIPPCCPVSRNPRPGSTLTVVYRAKEQVLEVASLYAYLHQFVGGLRASDGQFVVRDMEGMLLRVAQDCAQAVNVPVRIYARWHVAPRQQVKVIARGYPQVVGRAHEA